MFGSHDCILLWEPARYLVGPSPNSHLPKSNLIHRFDVYSSTGSESASIILFSGTFVILVHQDKGGFSLYKGGFSSQIWILVYSWCTKIGDPEKEKRKDWQHRQVRQSAAPPIREMIPFPSVNFKAAHRLLSHQCCHEWLAELQPIFQTSDHHFLAVKWNMISFILKHPD